jgi:hypothetical protein
VRGRVGLGSRRGSNPTSDVKLSDMGHRLRAQSGDLGDGYWTGLVEGVGAETGPRVVLRSFH